MNISYIVATISIEVIIFALSGAAFVFLLREFLSRKSLFLLFSALSFLSVSLGFILLFSGQVLSAYFGPNPVIQTFIFAPVYALLGETLFLFLLLIDLYAGKQRKNIFAAAALILTSASAIYAVGEAGTTVTVKALAAPDLNTTQFLAMFGGWLAANLFLAVIARGRFLTEIHRGNGQPADILFSRAGLAGLALFAIGATAVWLRIDLFLISLLVLMLHLVIFFFASAAKKYPDPAVAKRPVNFILRSLIFKAIGLNVALFWLIAFLILTIVSNYFVSASVELRKQNLRRDLNFLTAASMNFNASLLAEAAQLALSPQIYAYLQAGDITQAKDAEAFLTNKARNRIVRILDSGGVVRFSSFSAAEVGGPLRPSNAVTAALNGKGVAAIEKDDGLGRWMVRAAYPIVSPDRTIAAVLVSNDVIQLSDLTEQTSLLAARASYGLISDGGEPVYTYATSIDGVLSMKLSKHVAKANTAEGEIDSALFFIKRQFATDDASNGIFYILLPRDVLDSETFRILATAIIIVILLLAALTAVLIFSVTVVLRPIRELRSAASRVAHGNYDARVAYQSPDELGQLAEAFTAMSEAISDRTKRLNGALSEARDFLSYTAHELRTPLNIFRWTIDLLRYGDTGKLNKEQLELIEQLNQTNQRLLVMVQNLLDASFLEQQTVTLKKDFFRLEDIIEEAAGNLAVKIRDKNLTFHWKRPDQPLPPVFGDHMRVYQVFVNLLSNAVKYTPAGGHVQVRAEEQDSSGPIGKKGKFLRVEVEDSGIGIPKDQRDRIFTRFFRAKNIDREAHEGTGLGLFIAKKLAVLGGGEMWFESEEGSGSIFYFTVPTEKSLKI